MKDLKQKALRGGLIRILVQGFSLTIRIVSMVVLARLLDPHDFGLVAMVTTVTGVFSIFRDFGLSTATIQSPTITHEQLSTLFWLNMLIALVLAGLTLASAPILVEFYHEPRLFWVTVALSFGFLFNGAAVQHSALLERHMRYGTKAIIEVLNQLISTTLGIVMALEGYGYWTLVAMAVAPTVTWMIGVWIGAAWMPGLPHRNAGIRSMLRFGGGVTLTWLILYLAHNLDKLLLGKFWGAEPLGLYGRVGQLIAIPVDSLNDAIGNVAFSALSRIQDDLARFRRFFLKGHVLVISLTIPISIVCGLFASDVILVMLGPKWAEAARILQLLSPTMFVSSITLQLSSMLFAKGQIRRNLHINLVLSGVMATAYILGIPEGPVGVARYYCLARILWLLPNIMWSLRGTAISVRDLLVATSRPLLSGLLAGALTLASTTSITEFVARLLSDPSGLSAWQVLALEQWQLALPRLVAECALLFLLYILILFIVMRQKDFYLSLWRDLKTRPET